MSVYTKVIGPGNRERLVKRKELIQLAIEGAEYAGFMDGYECYVFHRGTVAPPRAVSGQAIIARGDESCRLYSPGQRMGNLYELAGA